MVDESVPIDEGQDHAKGVLLVQSSWQSGVSGSGEMIAQFLHLRFPYSDNWRALLLLLGRDGRHR